MNLDILVAGRAPPQEGEDDMYCTSPAQCVPISPATAHPEQRAPLVPSNALPWSDGCYLHTLQMVNAFVSRIHHVDCGEPTVLTKEDITRALHYATGDQYDTPRKNSGQDDEHEEEDGEAYQKSEGSYYSEGASDLKFTTALGAQSLTRMKAMSRNRRAWKTHSRNP